MKMNSLTNISIALFSKKSPVFYIVRRSIEKVFWFHFKQASVFSEILITSNLQRYD
ncbi:hypothetical protein SCB49_01582 [unidentified eubacterium SCB49]|nr:hypothetical protein SCB49_01582 [unidentified eubacterium SCB49]